MNDGERIAGMDGPVVSLRALISSMLAYFYKIRFVEGRIDKKNS